MSEAVYYGQRVAAARAGGRAFRPAIALLILAVAALGAVAFFSFIAPGLVVRNWNVETGGVLDPASLLAWAGVKGEESFFGLDAESLRERISAHPEVLSASVHKAFPDTVTITAIPRVPAALILAEVEGAMALVAVDAEGVLMREGRAEESAGLPLVSGLALPRFDFGARLPKRFLPFLASLAALARSNPALLAPFSEIRVSRKEGELFDLVLYPIAAPIRILSPSVLNEGLLQDMILALDIVKSWDRGSEVEKIDFRSETVTFTTRKEAALGR